MKDIEVGSKLLFPHPESMKLEMQRTGQRRSGLQLPFEAVARNWQHLYCEFPIVLTIREPRELAQRLNELDKYSISFQCTYQDMNGNIHELQERISGSFENYKAAVMSHWKQQKCHELIYIVKEI